MRHVRTEQPALVPVPLVSLAFWLACAQYVVQRGKPNNIQLKEYRKKKLDIPHGLRVCGSRTRSFYQQPIDRIGIDTLHLVGDNLF